MSTDDIRTTGDFDSDRRWCGACSAYVRYLLSPGDAWCTGCGRRVELFSAADREAFQRSLRSGRGFALDGPEREYA